MRASFLRTTCFTNNYMFALLSKYGITTLKNVDMALAINNNTVGWTLGYLIDQLNREDFLPYEAPSRKLPREFFIPAIIVASVFTVFAFIILLAYIFFL
jgi:hypothetical protein